MAAEMDKATLIARIQDGRREMEALLAQLSEAQMVEAGIAEGWSVKDLLSHITYWERDTVDVLKAAARGETPYLTGPEETDARNAEAVARNRDRPAAAVVADYFQTIDDLIAQVETLSEADLTDPNRFPWEEGKPLWKHIAGESYAHEHEHREQIRAWLLRSTSPA